MKKYKKIICHIGIILFSIIIEVFIITIGIKYSEVSLPTLPTLNEADNMFANFIKITMVFGAMVSIYAILASIMFLTLSIYSIITKKKLKKS